MRKLELGSANFSLRDFSRRNPPDKHPRRPPIRAISPPAATMRVIPFPLRLRLRRIPLKLSGRPKVPAGVPAFAAGPYKTYKLRNKILAGGKTIIFGNNVSEFKNKSRRTWRPNIKRKHIWSETLERRLKLKMTTSVMRTIEKVGGLDAYLTCTTRRRMKELGPRGWELRAKIIELVREKERGKHVRMLQRSIMLCPLLRMDSEWNDIRPFIQHTEGYAILPENVCKKAFVSLMERMREGRPVGRRTTFQASRIYGGKRGNAIAQQVMMSKKRRKPSTTRSSVSAPRPERKIKKANIKRKVQTKQKKRRRLPETMKQLEQVIQKAQRKSKKEPLRRRSQVKPKTEVRVPRNKERHSQEFYQEARNRIKIALAQRAAREDGRGGRKRRL